MCVCVLYAHTHTHTHTRTQASEHSCVQWKDLVEVHQVKQRLRTFVVDSLAQRDKVSVANVLLMCS